MSDAITADEVARWFGNRGRRPSPEMCVNAADILDRMRRIKNGEDVPWIGGGPAVPEQVDFADQTWDPKAVLTGIRSLIASLPEIKQQTEIFDPSQAENLGILEQILKSNIEYLEWYLRTPANKRASKKDGGWHLYAVSIAYVVAKLRVVSGQKKTSYERGSQAVNITYNALIRIGFKLSESNKSSISQHLKRFFAHAGEPPMTTN